MIEPEVIQPVVPDFATAEAPIVEPEALPDLPVPGETETEPAPEPEPEPEPLVAEARPEPEPEPEPVAVLPEPEPVMAETAQEPEAPEPEPTMAATEPSVPTWDEPAEGTEAAETQPEDVPTVATTEPSVPTWDEPAPEVIAAEPEPVVEPEPVHDPDVQAESMPEPAPASAEHSAQPAPDVSSTLVAWPTNSPAASRDNGTPAESGSFEEATSVIPAWRQTDPNADPRRTVSLQAMPPEQVAEGTEFAALLTFESGPFAGRIVALPSQMVTIGRAPDNDVVVGDPATSGHHGRIEVRTGSFWISDLGSTNGTLVNGEPVIEKQLSDGDTIAIGQSTLRFTLEA